MNTGESFWPQEQSDEPQKRVQTITGADALRALVCELWPDFGRNFTPRAAELLMRKYKAVRANIFADAIREYYVEYCDTQRPSWATIGRIAKELQAIEDAPRAKGDGADIFRSQWLAWCKSPQMRKAFPPRGLPLWADEILSADNWPEDRAGDKPRPADFEGWDMLWRLWDDYAAYSAPREVHEYNEAHQIVKTRKRWGRLRDETPQNVIEAKLKALHFVARSLRTFGPHTTELRQLRLEQIEKDARTAGVDLEARESYAEQAPY